MLDKNGSGTPDLVVEFPVEFYGSIDAGGILEVIACLHKTYDQVRVSISGGTNEQRGSLVMSCFNVEYGQPALPEEQVIRGIVTQGPVGQEYKPEGWED